eukprot:TRINITY_DN19101_c0_g1_i1.p1 TRINITY_DN19101_c0_g1~~TRINITY_DN19101_c0_g1_i1.p1  ORF type:complete len:546 (-),score=153.89 TRINITY_DN19101_c0_g1_i1:5-1402(-)
MMVIASRKQEEEIGDGTNFVVVFAGELLQQAESLIRMGLHPSEIVAGYAKALTFTLKTLEEDKDLVATTVSDLKDESQLALAIRTAIASKQYGREAQISKLIAQTCLLAMPKTPSNFNVDNVRVAKILGGGLSDSTVVKGFVLAREPEGTVLSAENAKIAVYSCPFEMGGTETKGTVLFNSAKEMTEFSAGEEKLLQKVIDDIARAGVNVVVCGSNVSELALNFLERHHIMCVKVPTKFDLRRVCRTVGATPLVRMDAPTPEEMGHCDSVHSHEIGSTRVTVFRQDSDDSKVATLILRGATQNILDDIERAVDDGVNVVKQLTRDGRLLAGAGAAEIELARRVRNLGAATTTLEQYAISKFAESFEVVPRTLAENAGLDETEIVSSLYAAHERENGIGMGVDVDGGGLKNAAEAQIYDHLLSKLSAIRLATDVACTVLRVNQIIMAKTAGGPKPPAQRGGDFEDD